MAEVILRTERLTKHYGGVHALENANFELHKGEHVRRHPSARFSMRETLRVA